MKKKKTLTPEEKAAREAERAAAKAHLDKAIDTFAGDKTPEEWSMVFKHCAKERFASGYILTRCHKKIAFDAYINKTPYRDIKPAPLFCERTFKRYIEEFEKLSELKKLIWTIVAILSGEMFFFSIFFGAVN